MSIPSAFEVGRNIATTPGKVVKQTKLYQLIQYAPTTEQVLETPLIIFPPWINRYYILDLNPKKSFIQWAVEQGLTVFVVSWKSADESLADVTLDDYVARRDRGDRRGPRRRSASRACMRSAIASPARCWPRRWPCSRRAGEADKVASATFFTAQVDFSRGRRPQAVHRRRADGADPQLSADKGYLDGRYMAATFNLLRGRDLIWNYVTNNYLLGQDYPQFDLLHWNGDTTNLPANWHRAYLQQLYRENRLVQPGALTIDGTPIDLRTVKTPTYVQAGREDHIAPPAERLEDHPPFRRAAALRARRLRPYRRRGQSARGRRNINIGPTRRRSRRSTQFIAGATETKGSWWPDWIGWIRAHLGRGGARRAASRMPGKGRLKAIEDAPGSYVKAR